MEIEVVDPEEEISVENEEVALAAAEEILAALEKCIKLYALTAVRNAKFLSSQQKASQFFAKNVILRIRNFNS